MVDGPQAWTGGGVNTLVVYVRGDAPAFVETSPGTILMNGMGTDIWDNVGPVPVRLQAAHGQRLDRGQGR